MSGRPVIPIADDGHQPSRRDFLKLSAATLAFAGLGACSRAPQETIVPAVHGQAGRTTGLPDYFATAWPHAGYASGVLVAVQDGRPTKVEGNPRHPASLGATDVWAQAAVLDLWDPNRSQAVLLRRELSNWDAFVDALAPTMAALAARGGDGFALLTRTVTSPTLAAQIADLQARMPKMRWYADEPVSRAEVFAGSRLAFGRSLEPRYAFAAADTIVSLDADFLSTMPGAVRHAHDFASRRGPAAMNRLYVFEPATTITGSRADHRFPTRATEVAIVARALAAATGCDIGPPVDVDPSLARVVAALADDLEPGRSLVVVGDRQPAVVHALAHAINDRLGNVGHTVTYAEPVAASVDCPSVADLSAALDRGDVDTLLIVDANPVYDAPADAAFGKRIARAKTTIHVGLHRDETADAATWHVPLAHPFETWSDARAVDGTTTILQPLIAPLYGGRSAHEVLAACAGRARSAHDVVRDRWAAARGGDAASFDRFWRQSLHDGVVADSASPPVTPRVDGAAIASGAAAIAARAPTAEVAFAPDPSTWDGRYAANGWLQELPRPFTKIAWDNVALLSPAFAARLGVASQDLIEIARDGRRVVVPAWIDDGHADDAITVHVGNGRRLPLAEGRAVGVDVQPLTASRSASTSAGFATGIAVRRVDGRAAIASTQSHHRMEGRDIARSIARDDVEAATQARRGGSHPEQPSLYPPVKYDGYRWGMAIDLSACIGCNACTIACQAENNIPIVGRDEVARGRAMHWIRVDHYVDRDDRGELRTDVQPVPCMQCEDAPCEVVCPTEASVHDDEGINVQVYNRCIGTRFCSNNCPYKVRRFNWFEYSSADPSIMGQKNPEVSVRGRGVMEKCNYCLQRITIGRIEAEKAGRPIRDGDVVTACQAVCPTGAIVFGDLNDRDSRVAAAKANPLDYALLEELGTRPRTTYQARVTNPNPALRKA